MEMTMKMPATYVEMTDEEMMYVDGGSLTAVAVVGIIGGCVGTVVGLYNIGYAGGLRAYYAGLRNANYQNIKWQVRAGVVGLFGLVGATVMVGFENGFYSKVG
jgi:lactobin A/cerein 7B family class IIb bacteriocin